MKSNPYYWSARNLISVDFGKYSSAVRHIYTTRLSRYCRKQIPFGPSSGIQDARKTVYASQELILSSCNSSLFQVLCHTTMHPAQNCHLYSLPTILHKLRITLILNSYRRLCYIVTCGLKLPNLWSGRKVVLYQRLNTLRHAALSSSTRIRRNVAIHW
jgi:hypothetical protein